ncbi:MAG: hypothetical protein M1819_000191 [Sarea resinae]|nr:MAG: hypothetical protein M1819_000191 [Sarea resinae]
MPIASELLSDVQHRTWPTEYGILTPLSESTNSNTDRTSAGASRKRKRPSGNLGQLPKEPLIIQPHPFSASDRPQYLSPLLLLPRSRLPLSCLAVTGNAINSTTRLFSSKIEELETSLHGDVNNNEPQVLISKLDDDQVLCAVERVRSSIYAICRLAHGVNLETLRATAAPACSGGSLAVLSSAANRFEDQWWGPAAIEYDVSSSVSRGGIEAENGMVRTCMKRLIDESEQKLFKPTQVELSKVFSGELVPTESTVDNLPTPQEAIDIVISQYLEALYISKTSLAYFAKGPLSRARASFHRDTDSAASPSDLAAALKSLILPLNSMDKKYRESLTNLVQSTPLGNLSDFEDGSGGRKRKRRKKKMQPGKDGLFPQEEEFVMKWWRMGDPAEPTETTEAWLKRRLAQLRTREIELQVILVLETLALDRAAMNAPKETKLGVHVQETKKGDEKLHKKRAGKKLQDPAWILELLIDRLCIWQSVNNADIDMSKSASNEHSQTKHEKGGSKKSEDDGLRDFCIEVIVPFFASRLPKECAMVNKRLGGPPIAQPSHSHAPKVSSSQSRPGAAIKRSATHSDARSALKRTQSDLKSASRHQPAPARAIRAPSVPNLKREKSETPLLHTIPTQDSLSQSITAHRHDTDKYRRFSQREVDLFAISTSHEAKLKRKKDVEDELKQAISALKKPNRVVATKEFVESVERRRTSEGGKLRSKYRQFNSPLPRLLNGCARSNLGATEPKKSSTQAGNSSSDRSFAASGGAITISSNGVQVLATPRTNRQKHIAGISASHASPPSVMNARQPQQKGLFPSSKASSLSAYSAPRDTMIVAESATANQTYGSAIHVSPRIPGSEPRAAPRSWNMAPVDGNAAGGTQETPSRGAQGRYVSHDIADGTDEDRGMESAAEMDMTSPTAAKRARPLPRSSTSSAFKVSGSVTRNRKSVSVESLNSPARDVSETPTKRDAAGTLRKNIFAPESSRGIVEGGGGKHQNDAGTKEGVDVDVDVDLDLDVRGVGAGGGGSIYASLGWDDYDDDLI